MWRLRNHLRNNFRTAIAETDYFMISMIEKGEVIENE